MTPDTAESENATSPYERLGGEPTVRAVCSRLYELMDVLPEAQACRDIHPPSLKRAEEKLFEFMSGWLGGPQLYRQKHGHPRLRQRHLVARIGNEETSGWLACFHQAWKEVIPASPLASELAERIDALGWHMHNADETGSRKSPCDDRQRRRGRGD